MQVAARLTEDANIFDRELLGSIIQIAPESDFGNTLWFMKFADSTWRRVVDFTYHRGQSTCRYNGDPPIDPHDLEVALAAQRVSRPLEGIHLGDYIKASVQMHALPDGAVIINPQTGSVYHKKDGHFFTADGKDLPSEAFRHFNAKWEK